MTSNVDTITHVPSQSSHRARAALRAARRADWAGQADAELLRAWRDWQAAARAQMKAPSNLSDAEGWRLYAAVEAAADRICEMTPSGTAGLAVRLKLLFSRWSEDPDVHYALAYGDPITDDMLPDGRTAHAWAVIQDAERMAAA